MGTRRGGGGEGDGGERVVEGIHTVPHFHTRTNG